MRYEAVFFDLDGTLVGVDMEEFLADYLTRIGRWASRRYDPEVFLEQLMSATGAMVQNDDPTRTNQEVFLQRFMKTMSEENEEQVLDLFDRFYREEFPQMRGLVQPLPGAGRLVRALRDEGCRLILATNPVFPRRAIHQRVLWGGLHPDQFEYITSYENSRYCKPNPRYFADLLHHCAVEPDEVLMVGNDPLEDLVAGELGMDTFLVDEYIVQRCAEEAYEPSYRGSLDDVLAVTRG